MTLKHREHVRLSVHRSNMGDFGYNSQTERLGLNVTDLKHNLLPPHQYTPPDYLPKVCDELPMQPTHREVVVNAFVFVHKTLHEANARLSKRGSQVMVITPRHYLDFINHYVSTVFIFYLLLLLLLLLLFYFFTVG